MLNNSFDVKNIPNGFKERMKNELGDEYEDFIASYEKPYRSALRINALKIDGANDEKILTAKKLIEDEGISLSPVSFTGDGFYYDENSRPGKLPFHDAGLYYMQEPSAMLPATLLNAQPGDRVLDLCAAPGGKTTAIAAQMKGEGILVANEIHPSRAKILSSNVERMGIRNCFVVNSSPDELSKRFDNFFDKIIVDAPCSGEGMFRKEPEAINCWSTSNIKLCADRQADILQEAAKMLAPGGTLVYSTCTFAKEEDELQMSNFISKHSEFTLEKTERLWPHKFDGEGHFAAVLKKNGSSADSKSNYQILKKSPKVDSAAVKLWKEFESLNLKRGLNGTLLSYGENLYLAPCNLDINNLKCLRPGLHLGMISKGRFTPSYALATALTKEDLASDDVSLDISISDAKKYVAGESLRVSSEVSGWVLVFANGISLSWGKISGGNLKNHFPKGLRHN